MERDAVRIYIFVTLVISTHTLTWSVTLVSGKIATAKIISTHTLTWSVTIGRLI